METKPSETPVYDWVVVDRGDPFAPEKKAVQRPPRPRRKPARRTQTSRG
jgi:hypothetical protein